MVVKRTITSHKGNRGNGNENVNENRNGNGNNIDNITNNKNSNSETKGKEFFIKHSKKHNTCAPYIEINSRGNGKGNGKGKSKKTKKGKGNDKDKKINRSKNIKSLSANTCLDKKSVFKLIREYNKNAKEGKKIKLLKATPDKMLVELKQIFQDKCGNNELCIINQDFIDDDLEEKLEMYYKPEMPQKWYQDKNTWLNTLDIDAVLRQYEIKYPEFRFFGPTPIDFDKVLHDNQCVDNDLCHINVKKLYKQGVKYLGVVFNLDPHDKGGSHWIAMFCNLKKCEICYWDSYAYKPPKEVTALMNKLKSQCKSIGKNMKIKLTKNRHQYGDSECGVYSTHFIIRLLEGDSFESLVNKRIPDNIMNSYRSMYFVPI